ncbi:MAG: diguanylate cyclase [Leptothrix sp. (in: b-proteobacteria)]
MNNQDRLAQRALTESAIVTLQLLGVAIAYYLAARLGLLIPYVGTHVSLVWLPTGIAIAAYLRWGGLMSASVFAAAFAVNVQIGGPVWMGLGIAVGNTLGPGLAVLMLRRSGFDPALTRRRDLGVYLVAVMAGMIVTASNGTLWLRLAELLPASMWGSAWMTWWVGDAVGALLGGIPLVAMSSSTVRATFGGRRGLGNAALLGVVLGCGVWSFSPWSSPALLFPLLSVPLFVTAVLALRAGVLAASLSVLLLSGAMAWGTAQGIGPFAGHDAHAGLLALWSYITAQACTSVLICGLAAERKDAQARLAISEQRLRLITNNVPALIAYLDREHRFVFANETYADWFGIRTDSLLGKTFGDCFGAAFYAARQPHMDAALRTGHRQTLEVVSDLGGRQRQLRSTYVPDLRSDGSVAGLYMLSMDISELKAVEAQLTRLARFDHLTGLANRMQFDDRLQEALARSRRTELAMALLYIDIDHFKTINDTQGHAAGDAVLTEFARRLKASVRATDTVARLGGDEFVVVIEQLHHDDEATLVARKIAALMQTPIALANGAMAVTASIGVGLLNGGAQASTAGEIMATADRALYDAKHAGRNTYRVRVCGELRDES